MDCSLTGASASMGPVRDLLEILVSLIKPLDVESPVGALGCTVCIDFGGATAPESGAPVELQWLLPALLGGQ